METRFAGFWIRFVANLIDAGILTAVSFFIERVFSLFVDTDGLGLQIFMLFVYSVISISYYTYGHYKYGTTLGKKPFRIRVVTYPNLQPLTLWKSLLRASCYMLSWLPFGCGFIMAGLNRTKAALHDLIAGTVSIREAR